MSSLAARVSRCWASAWLRTMFWCSSTVPGIPRTLRPIAVRLAWMTSGSVRHAARANARRLLGQDVTPPATRRYALAVIGRFYDAVVEFGANRARDPNQIASRTLETDGLERYHAARKLRRGAILVTAHLGSFETAIGSLRSIEDRIHVVFQRDHDPLFEELRSRQRQRLGVIEAPVDEGLATWLTLRDALQHDDVVLLQADRCMPGQRGEEFPFLGGHLRVPTGPARLARLTGSPVIPVFAINTPNRSVRVVLTEPIHPEAHPASPASPDPITAIITDRIEHIVKQHPDQWLCLHPVLTEDQPAETVS